MTLKLNLAEEATVLGAFSQSHVMLRVDVDGIIRSANETAERQLSTSGPLDGRPL